MSVAYVTSAKKEEEIEKEKKICGSSYFIIMIICYKQHNKQ